MDKPTDDAMARTVAESRFGDTIHEYADRSYRSPNSPIDHDEAVRVARDHLAVFPSVRFETVTAVDADRSITMRRLILTGPWEVDPSTR